MSVDKSDVGEADVMLAKALAQAVREVGRTLAKEPRRVQGMVSDVLGADSRTRRAEIDAVVLAAEEGVPEDLLADRITVDVALARLRARGLDAAVATFAVEVWRYALGMLEADAQPPSLTNSLEHSTPPVATDPAPVTTDGTFESPPTINAIAPPPGTSYPQQPGFVAPPPPPPPPQPFQQQPQQRQRPPRSSATPKRRWLLIAAPLVVLAVIAGIIGVVVASNSDDKPTAAPTTSATPSTTIGTSTTTTQPATTTTATTLPGAPQRTFAMETTSLGDLTRTWTVNGTQLDATLSFHNAGTADVTDIYYEVVPKSLRVRLR